MDFEKYGINSVPDLLAFMQKNLRYGFTDHGQVYQEGPEFGPQMDQFYKLKTGEDLINSGYGVCWDFCELAREFCEQNNIPHHCYFMLSWLNQQQGGPTHTFLTFEENDKCYWLEYAWQAHRGLWEYPDQATALHDILRKFNATSQQPYARVDLYQTENAPARLNFREFIDHCVQGERIDVQVLKTAQTQPPKQNDDLRLAR